MPVADHPKADILLHQNDRALVAALRFPVLDLGDLINDAHAELSAAMDGRADPLWGWFPQHPDQTFVNARPLPACEMLDVVLRERVLAETSFTDLRPAFIRLCLRDIRGKEHGGFHVDIDTGSAFVGDKANDGTRNICKLLINLHPTEPRELRYLPYDLDDLADRGLVYRRDSYRGVPERDLPAGIVPSSVHVPPRENGVLHGLAFYADLVAHTGVDHANGHFLAGYGGYRPAGAFLLY